jgi:hypothetical protein
MAMRAGLKQGRGVVTLAPGQAAAAMDRPMHELPGPPGWPLVGNFLTYLRKKNRGRMHQVQVSYCPLWSLRGQWSVSVLNFNYGSFINHHHPGSNECLLEVLDIWENAHVKAYEVTICYMPELINYCH